MPPVEGAVAVPAAAPPPPVPAPPKLGVSLPLLFCDIVFYLLTRD
jgi:hypothetical protein